MVSCPRLQNYKSEGRQERERERVIPAAKNSQLSSSLDQNNSGIRFHSLFSLIQSSCCLRLLHFLVIAYFSEAEVTHLAGIRSGGEDFCSRSAVSAALCSVWKVLFLKLVDRRCKIAAVIFPWIRTEEARAVTRFSYDRSGSHFLWLVFFFVEMETILVIAQHRNQGYSRSKGYTHGFKGVNCRAFQSCAGILQSPKSPHVRSEPPKPSRRSNPITVCPKHFTFSGSCSELWAGPTYSNSPAPSSLPIPKLSLRQKRSISLALPDSVSSIFPQPEIKSAPASRLCVSPDSFPTAASATENLRRILNLDPEN